MTPKVVRGQPKVEDLSGRFEGRLVVVEPLALGHAKGLVDAASWGELFKWMPEAMGDSPGFRRVPHVTQRLWKAFDALLSRAGLELTDLYMHGREHEELYQLAELLTEWDERLWLWRFRHYAIVARALGEDTIGTQGTPVQVLGKLIAQRQIPKLWDVRSRLVELFDAERKGSPA